jgi:hypothetical protein
MKTTHSVMNFTQQAWWEDVKQLQRLQTDVAQQCANLGVPQAVQCELLLRHGVLTMKASAGLITRIRHIEPELKQLLNSKAWNITAIELSVVRNASGLSKHLTTQPWLNPNIARYGKRTLPSESQRAQLLAASSTIKNTNPKLKLKA